ncbi:MAG: HD domain-containing protein, partial [Bacteroidetes bacterium]
MSDKNKIYLAALLHDIGKFWQRASEPYEKDGDNLSENTRQLIQYICPKDVKQQFGYYHVLWTSEFFEKYKQKFPEELRATASSQRNDDNTANLAAYHHYPSTELQAIVALADHWSSGSDRLNEENMEEDTSLTNFRETPLRHIFDMINTSFKESEDPRYAEDNHYV